ncbi:MAG: LOG family protein [Ignavibacteriales bacterium]|nr:LOG family protein [Ignavibacteriales bacterium]
MGLGIMDELFEIITLVQTAKVRKKLAVIIYDKKYWNKIINFDALVELGMISKSDLSLFTMCDTIDEAYDAIIRHLKKYYSKEKEPKSDRTGFTSQITKNPSERGLIKKLKFIGSLSAPGGLNFFHSLFH